MVIDVDCNDGLLATTVTVVDCADVPMYSMIKVFVVEGAPAYSVTSCVDCRLPPTLKRKFGASGPLNENVSVVVAVVATRFPPTLNVPTVTVTGVPETIPVVTPPLNPSIAVAEVTEYANCVAGPGVPSVKYIGDANSPVSVPST